MGLLIFGIIATVCGFASVIYGNYMNNDFSSQLAHYGSSMEPGALWIIIGIAAIVIGVILIICGIYRFRSEKNIDREYVHIKIPKKSPSYLLGTAGKRCHYKSRI